MYHGGMERSKILIIGELIYDLISVEKDFSAVESFLSFAGGPAGNVAVNLSCLGTECGVIAAIGADPSGEFLQHYLGQAGVDLSLLQINSGTRTSMVCVWNVREEPCYFPLVTRRPRIGWNEKIQQALARSRMIALSSSVLADDDFFIRLEETVLTWETDKPQLVMDLNLIDLELDEQLEQRLQWICPRLDYLQVSWMNLLRHHPRVDGASAALSVATEWLQSLDCPAVVLTRGRDGYRVITAGFVQDVSVSEFPILSSSGAGDGFFAGVIHGLTQGLPLTAAIRLGENTARRVLGQLAPHLPGE